MPERADFPLVVIGEVWSNTITLGAALIFALVLALGGVFTLKSKLGSYWKEDANEQRARAERCAELLSEARQELAACRARTDLEPVLQAMHESMAMSASRHETWRTELTANTHVVRGLVAQINEMTKVLTQVAKAMEARNNGAEASNDQATREDLM